MCERSGGDFQKAVSGYICKRTFPAHGAIVFFLFSFSFHHLSVALCVSVCVCERVSGNQLFKERTERLVTKIFSHWYDCLVYLFSFLSAGD